MLLLITVHVVNHIDWKYVYLTHHLYTAILFTVVIMCNGKYGTDFYGKSVCVCTAAIHRQLCSCFIH